MASNHTTDSNASPGDWEIVELDTPLSRVCQAFQILTAGTIAPVRLGQSEPEDGCDALPYPVGQFSMQVAMFATPVSGTPATILAQFNTERIA